MSELTTEAIVLHAFDYLESSRILRLVTRDAGVRSALARGARRSSKRFGAGLGLFSEGTAHLHVRPGRDLDTLAGFEAARLHSRLGEDLERFAGASALAELTLRMTTEASADVELFDVFRDALDQLEQADRGEIQPAMLASGWRLVHVLGYAPSLTSCIECDENVDQGEPVLFSLTAGGVICPPCAGNRPGRVLPPRAREAIGGWLGSAGATSSGFTPQELRAHQRLFYEFVREHLLEGKAAPAIDLWYRGLDPAATA